MARRINRGLILNQPWARLVAEGVIPVLVRPFKTTIRGPVAIAATGVDPFAIVDQKELMEEEFPQPAIVGTVEIIECIEVPVGSIQLELRRSYGAEFAKFYPKHYLPKHSPAYLWILGNPRLFKRAKVMEKFRSRVWKRL